jgi:hypothetical protein
VVTFLQKYRKAEMSLLATVAVLWVTAAQAGPVHLVGWLAIVGSIASTVAVAGLPNTVTAPGVKTAAQALAIAATGVGALLASHMLGTVGIVALLIQVAGVFGVEAVSNVGDHYDRAVRARAVRSNRGLETGIHGGL